MRERIKLSNGFDYAGLAEGVEAWGFRLMQARGEFISREEVARTWFEEEYEPVTEMIREARLEYHGTETEAYARVVSLRYLLLRTHAWDDEVLERLRGGVAPALARRGHLRAAAAQRPRGLSKASFSRRRRPCRRPRRRHRPQAGRRWWARKSGAPWCRARAQTPCRARPCSPARVGRPPGRCPSRGPRRRPSRRELGQLLGAQALAAGIEK